MVRLYSPWRVRYQLMKNGHLHRVQRRMISHHILFPSLRSRTRLLALFFSYVLPSTSDDISISTMNTSLMSKASFFATIGENVHVYIDRERMNFLLTNLRTRERLRQRREIETEELKMSLSVAIRRCGRARRVYSFERTLSMESMPSVRSMFTLSDLLLYRYRFNGNACSKSDFLRFYSSSFGLSLTFNTQARDSSVHCRCFDFRMLHCWTQHVVAHHPSSTNQMSIKNEPHVILCSDKIHVDWFSVRFRKLGRFTNHADRYRYI